MGVQNEIETWTQALKAYDEDDYAKALDLFGVRVPKRGPETESTVQTAVADSDLAWPRSV